MLKSPFPSRPAAILTFVVVFAVSLGACSQSSVLSFEKSHNSDNSDLSLSFRYDAISKSCRNTKGQTGYNVGFLGECGSIEKSPTRYEYAKLQGQNLRGLRVVESSLKGANFSDADLTGAVFEKTQLSFAQFRNADLSGATFDLHSDDFELHDALRGARIDGDTRFLIKDWDLQRLGREGVIFSSATDDRIERKLGVAFDARLSSIERSLVASDLFRLQNLRLKLPGSDEMGEKLFDDAFGESAAGPAGFALERIHMVGPGSKSDSTSIYATNLSLPIFKQELARMSLGQLAKSTLLLRFLIDDAPAADDSLTSDANYEPYRFNGKEFQLKDSRVGYLSLGPFYLNARGLSTDRAIALVHEARHSDCPQNAALEQRIQRLSSEVKIRKEKAEARLLEERQHPSTSFDRAAFVRSELTAARELRNEIEATLTQINSTPGCAYIHADCPSDHPDPVLRGLKHECDSQAWGSFGVQAVFAQALAKGCEDCSEIERQRAAAAGLDAFNRVIPIHELVDWKSPPPKMQRDHFVVVPTESDED